MAAERLLQMKLAEAVSKYPEVLTLNLVHGDNSRSSDMNDKLKILLQEKYIQNYNVVLAFEGNNIIGWAWFFHRHFNSGRRRYDFEVYVKKEHRRQGCGTILYRYVKNIVWNKRKRRLMTFPWDERSEGFFANMKGY